MSPWPLGRTCARLAGLRWLSWQSPTSRFMAPNLWKEPVVHWVIF